MGLLQMLAKKLRDVDGISVSAILNLMATAGAIGHHDGICLGPYRW
jgi:hypothetical protein